MKKVKSITQFNNTLKSNQLDKISGGAGATEYIILLILRNDNKESDGKKRP